MSFRRPGKFPDKRRAGIWFLVMGIVPAAVCVCGVIFYQYISGTLPSLENLERIEPPLISRVYDKDSMLVHEFFIERRMWTEYKDIPDRLKWAIISIEDKKFFHHWGVNLQAYPSALLPAIFGKRVRGASTLTQQLAKNLFLTPNRTIVRKIRELVLAIKIEQTYTKEEILEFYINQVYLGAGAYGFQSAAQKYFSKKLSELTAAQCALLAGLLQRPEAYRPDYEPERSKERRNLVLREMEGEGYLTRPELVDALTEDINLNLWSPRSLKAAYFVESIRQYLEKKWGEEFIYSKGVHVYSTLDSKIQDIADSSYRTQLKKTRLHIKYATARNLNMPSYLKLPIDSIVRHWDSLYAHFDSTVMNGPVEKSRLEKGFKPRFPDSLRYRTAQMAVIVIENKTGAVRALIGGEDYEKSKFNRAIQAVRSPGSSFKPIVYTTAIDNGGSPLDSVNDQPITIPDPLDSSKSWRPKNYDDVFEGNITLRRALYRSKNLPAIKTAIKYGLKTVVSYARRFGLEHSIPPVPSIGIGSCDATLMEMTSAYTVFPNGGIRPEPYFIRFIEDKDHRLLHKNIPRHHETIRKETAYIMTTMLRDVNIRGTGAAIWAGGFDHPSGGKTGTTNRETDAWYIGFTKFYTAGVWVGTDDYMPLGRGHTGSEDAVPLWLSIMKAVHKGLPKTPFDNPGGVMTVKICEMTGLQAGEFCSRTTTDVFLSGSQPDEVCDGNHQTLRKINNVGAAFSSTRKRMNTRTSDKADTVKSVRNVF